MTSDSRARMVRSAASLIRTRGVAGTSFSDVLADSGAPRGSIYHHFPEGKEQLAADAIKWTSERVLAHQRECPASTPKGCWTGSSTCGGRWWSAREVGPGAWSPAWRWTPMWKADP